MEDKSITKTRLIKIAIIGPVGAGKSSLFYRFSKRKPPDNVYSTNGIDFRNSQYKLDDKELLLQLWDTSGRERCLDMVKIAVNKADGIVFVYDITDEMNLNSAPWWIQQLRTQKECEMIIVGNKCDLEEECRQVSRLRGYQFASSYGAKFFEVSAKTGANVEESLETLLRDILDKRKDKKETQVPEDFLQDPFALNLYQKALEAGREKDKSIRINIVGNYRQGKTSLTKRLLGQDIKNIESTNGIVVEHYKCRKTKDGEMYYKEANECNSLDYIQRLAKVAVDYELKSVKDQETSLSLEKRRDANTKPEKKEIAVGGYMLPKDGQSTKAALTKNSETKTTSSSGQESNKTVQSKNASPGEPESNTTVQSKVSVLSNEEKSTFIKALKTVEASSEKETQTVFDIWDFGGQFIFYATHTIFHSRKAIYILVFDLSLDLSQVVNDNECPTESEGRNMKFFLQFWMSSIHSFVGSADGFLPKVILVGTHKDKLKGNASEREAYIKKYFNDVRQMFDDTDLLNHIYREDFAVDNLNAEDASVITLRETISKIGDEQSETFEMPLKWIHLEKSLVERRRLKLIPLKDVIAIDAENEFPLGDVEQVKLFLRYHHAKGTVVYFDEEPVSDYVVLDPQYLIDAFKSIITSERFCTNDPEIRPLWKRLFAEGRLEEGVIDKQWGRPGEADKKFSENKKVLLSFLEKHRIISEAAVFDEDTKQSTGLGWYVVPSLLKDHSSKTAIQDFLGGKKQTKLRYVFVFDSSPVVPTIYHRLISAAVGRWPVAKASKKTLLFKDLSILRLNIDHTAVVEMKVDTIEMTLVSLCPTADVDGIQADLFRRFCEAVVTFEFRKLRGPEETITKPYVTLFRCNHESHGVEGSEDLISFNDLVGRKLVPCPDLMTHEVRVDQAKGEWFQESKIISVNLDISLTDKLLSKISQCIGENWQLLGHELGLTKVQLDHIFEDHPRSAVMRIYAMLQKWCDEDADVATMAVLVQKMQQCQQVSFDWDKLRNIVDEL